MIREVIVGTRTPEGDTHLAPMGVHEHEQTLVLAPYRPSCTLDNLLGFNQAVINLCDDVCVYVGCLTGRRDWPMVAAHTVQLQRLRDVPAHIEVEVERVASADSGRPRFYCRKKYVGTHAPFAGFNRAQAAVLEAAILYTRLDRLPTGQVQRELEYLGNAVQKTAGPREQQAWDWLLEGIAAHPGAARK